MDLSLLTNEYALSKAITQNSVLSMRTSIHFGYYTWFSSTNHSGGAVGKSVRLARWRVGVRIPAPTDRNHCAATLKSSIQCSGVSTSCLSWTAFFMGFMKEKYKVLVCMIIVSSLNSKTIKTMWSRCVIDVRWPATRKKDYLLCVGIKLFIPIINW